MQIFPGILGFLILGEVPDEFSLAGYVLIFLGGIYAIRYETKKRKKERLSEAKKLELESEYEQV